jgi:biotin transport system substrate-specific component
VSPLDELLWAIIGLLLTIGGTFVEVSIPALPWTLNLNPVDIQVYPLGVTYQVGAVLLVGCLGGKNAGALSQIAYLALGLVGFQIFAYGGGISYLKEPTFGYLLGFVPGAWICGYLAFQRAAKLESLALSCLGGLVAVHLTGLIYLFFLSFIYPLGQTWWQAVLQYSVQPLPGQLVIVCAIAVLSTILRRLMFY